MEIEKIASRLVIPFNLQRAQESGGQRGPLLFSGLGIKRYFEGQIGGRHWGRM